MFLTNADPNVGEEVVEETLSIAEQIVDWSNKPGVQAVAIIGGIVIGCVLLYQFVVKPLLRKFRK